MYEDREAVAMRVGPVLDLWILFKRSESLMLETLEIGPKVVRRINRI